jgi:hypothetical protein
MKLTNANDLYSVACFNKKGKCLGVKTIDDWIKAEDESARSEEDAALRQSNGKPFYFPVLEQNFTHPRFQIELEKGNTLEEALTEVYNSKLHNLTRQLGVDGAVVSAVDLGENKFLIEYAANSFEKPQDATDMVTFVEYLDENQEKQVAFVGTIRTKEPGKGGPATVGGKIDITQDENGAYFIRSPAAIGVAEFGEELGLKIVTDYSEIEKDYNVEEFEFEIAPKTGTYVGETLSATMVSCGTYETSTSPLSEDGEALDGGRKRIYKASNFAVQVDATHLPVHSLDDVKKLFLVEDSGVSDFYVKDASEVNGADFGIQHHGKFFEDAAAKLGYKL